MNADACPLLSLWRLSGISYTHPLAGPNNSYYWVKGQRKLALTRAFLLLKQPDGTLARADYVQLMRCLRPDCDQEHVSKPKK